ncbi:unnamed protein product, partial [Mesorhabditis spiculigera]
MADQIKIRRRQRKDTLLSLTRESITATISALSQMPNSNVNNLQAALLYNHMKPSGAASALQKASEIPATSSASSTSMPPPSQAAPDLQSLILG